MYCSIPGVEIGGYSGGGLIQEPSARFIWRRSDAKCCRNTDAGTTRKYLPSQNNDYVSITMIDSRENYIPVIGCGGS
jgi:hypothetical protein